MEVFFGGKLTLYIFGWFEEEKSYILKSCFLSFFLPTSWNILVLDGSLTLWIMLIIKERRSRKTCTRQGTAVTYFPTLGSVATWVSFLMRFFLLLCFPILQLVHLLFRISWCLFSVVATVKLKTCSTFFPANFQTCLMSIQNMFIRFIT